MPVGGFYLAVLWSELMSVDTAHEKTFEQEILEWQQLKEAELRADDGWLTVVGLHWLHNGKNTVGSAPDADVLLPNSGPEQLGVIELDGEKAVLTLNEEADVQIDGGRQPQTVLRADTDPNGPSLVRSGSVTFFVIRRGDQFGIRVRDRDSVQRQTFAGRKWFPVNRVYTLLASFTPYPEPRTMNIVNIIGMLSPMQNVGYVQFTLHGEVVRLEAVKNSAGALWFIFKDATSGKTTYGGGRFLTAVLQPDNRVELDFNRAYHPPCAFTAYATCPIPPKENVLTIPIEAGERL
jgi:uncharacterized protein